MALNNPTDKQYVITVTITSGQTTSSAADIGDFVVKAIETPAAMTGSSLTFTATTDDSTYVPVKNSSNTALSVTIATGSAGIYMVAADSFAGLQKLKIVSGSSEGADRTLKLICYKA